MASYTREVQQLSAEVSYMTVDKLKATIKRLNETFQTNMKLSGLKNDLVVRLRAELDHYAPDRRSIEKIREIINHVKSNVPSSPPSHHAYNNGYQPAPALPAYRPPPPPPPPPAPYPGYPYGGGLPPPRFGPGPQAHASGSGLGAGANGGHAWNNQALNGGKVDEVPVRFKPSPFFRIEKSLSGITTLQKAAQGDRKSAYCQFALSEVQRKLLLDSKASPTNPQYQVRLFCTTEDFFNPARSSSVQAPAPIDFPGTCEIKLNSINISANTKGIKKQPGTAPPADLSKGPALNLAAAVLNKIEIIYVNTDKRYFLVVYLVEVTSVRQVVDKIKKAKFRSKEEVVKSIIAQNADPDVIATSQGLSLKDPLTFSRIKIPIRSIHCSHIGCFDAETFFMMNEQTPAWKCPICSMVLRVEDITVDGYFDDILKTCPSSIEAATVEPDGTWRSSDDKYGTGKPKAGNVQVTTIANDLDKGKGRAFDRENSICIDDSDDDDGETDSKPIIDRLGGFKRQKTNMISIESSPSPSSQDRSSGSGARRPKPMETIDLTMSSDDDEPPPPPPPQPVPRVANGSGPAWNRSPTARAAEERADLAAQLAADAAAEAEDEAQWVAQEAAEAASEAASWAARELAETAARTAAAMRAHEEARRLQLAQVDRRQQLELAQAEAVQRAIAQDNLVLKRRREADEDEAGRW